MKTLQLAIVLVVVSGALVLGHHSFAAHYFEEQSLTIEGTLVEFELRAPHAWVRFSASDAGGVARTYSAEWANPNRLTRDGITKDTLKAGDRVIVTGSPGRKASEYRIHLKGIERPSDGWTWRARRR